MAPKPPFRSVSEELLYDILQKLPDMTYLTAQDIDSLAKLNALILDADLAPAQEVQDAIDQIKGNVPAVADSLEKLYGIIQALNFLKSEDIDTLAELNTIITDADLLRGGDIQFPNVIFVSPNGDNSHGLKGDISRPFLPDGVTSVAVAGDTVKFLPGDYNIGVNIAVNGVDYGTLGGAVGITVSDPGIILFDYSVLANSNLAIHVDGEFDFQIDANAGGIFKFNKPGQTPRRYIINWRTAYQAGGVFLSMPILLTTGSFTGQIDVAAESAMPCIKCDPNGCWGTGVMKLVISNGSLTSAAVDPYFNGFMFEIAYNSTSRGLFNPPVGGVPSGNRYCLNVTQPVGALTYITSGDYDLALTGGSLIVMSDAIVSIKGVIQTCTFHAGPRADIVASFVASLVNILNDQVKLLVLDGVWRNCSYNRTSPSPVVLKGQFFQFTFLGSPARMTIIGSVELTDNSFIALGANLEYLDIQGTLIGNAQTIILCGLDCKVLISGAVKNLRADGQLIKTDHWGATYTLVLNGAILEAGSAATLGIEILLEDTIAITMFGKSFINKMIGGTGTINYQVGSGADLVVDAAVTVLP